MPPTPDQQQPAKVDEIVSGFKKLDIQDPNVEVFRQLEQELRAAGFELATNQEVQQIFNEPSLICRSEVFRKALEMIEEQTPIELENSDNNANACRISGSQGFRVAMEEGFGNKEIDGKAKVVITFQGNHLEHQSSLKRDDELWQTKPNSAEVSLAVSGDVYFEDVKLVSFRFPVSLFPENMLSENEMELLEEANLPFIVRHYKPQAKDRTLH
jgi:hypothetical protein